VTKSFGAAGATALAATTVRATMKSQERTNKKTTTVPAATADGTSPLDFCL